MSFNLSKLNFYLNYFYSRLFNYLLIKHIANLVLKMNCFKSKLINQSIQNLNINYQILHFSKFIYFNLFLYLIMIFKQTFNYNYFSYFQHVYLNKYFN